MGSDIIQPTSVGELREIIGDAIGTGAKLAIRGGGSRDGIGAPPIETARRLDMRGFTGIVDYDPAELVLTVRSATPLADVLEIVAKEGQMLAFEPFDPAPHQGAATIGGTVVAGTAGPLRLTRGGARDHLLAVKAVSGWGEEFVGGAKVVKNVTGYDLPKLIAGSWGRLAAVTEITLKVLPAPAVRVTCVLVGLSPRLAIAAMERALGSQADVHAAAHIPAYAPFGRLPVTAMRVPGFAASVESRCALLDTVLVEFGSLERVEGDACVALWNDVALAAPLNDAMPLWRISVPAREGAMVAEAIAELDGQWMMDWGGGLVWASVSAEPDIIRTLAAHNGGHASLVRAPEAVRRVVPAFHPSAAGVAALEQRVRLAFDPAGVFETGRF